MTTTTKFIAALGITVTALLGGAAHAQAQPYEDEPGFSCVEDGNRICGPDNPQGVQAGQYVNGTLVPWPHATIPAWCKDICLGA